MFRKRIQIRLQSYEQPKLTVSARLLHVLLWPAYAVGVMLVSLGAGVVWLLATSCRAVGFAVLWPPKAIGRVVAAMWKWLLVDIRDTVANAPARLHRVRRKEFAYGLVLFGALALSGFGLLSVGDLFAEGLRIKGLVLGQTKTAILQLEDGKDSILSEDLEAAQGRFATALQQFRVSRDILGEASLVVRGLLAVVPEGATARHLLTAGEAGSETLVHLTAVGSALKNMQWNSAGFQAGGSSAAVSAIQSRLELARESLARAIAATDKVNIDHIPAGMQVKFEETRLQLVGLQQAVTTLQDVATILQALSSGHKHVLVLMQNSNELRPSGGFVGTYGAFDLEDGVVKKQTVSSIYDLDGQLATRYIPPLPLFAVNDRWYLRDSNWFASFPESAETMVGFYEEEAGRTPDMVVALTPGLVTGLLEVTGPITVPGFATLNADNFIEVTQVETSVTYDRQENKPKKMLADFLPLFLGRLADLPSEAYPRVLESLARSIAAKDVLMYSRNSALQRAFENLSVDGRLADTARDYLSIVSANLGGTKTDLSMEQRAQLESVVSPAGSIVNTLQITRSNPLPNIAGLENKSFVRVYVPLGSKLLSSKGFSYVDLDTKYGSKGTVHPKSAAWEQDAVKTVDNGMLIGEEGGKTFFGNWINLSGGQRQTVELVYELPFQLSALDRHSLGVQKQAGAPSYALTYTLGVTGRQSLWATEETLVGEKLTKEFAVDRDRFFGVVLEGKEQ